MLGNLPRVLIVRRAIEATAAIITPISRSHATDRIPLSSLQVKQSFPDAAGEGWGLGALPALFTCIGTV